MTEGAFYQPKPMNRTALFMVVLLHGAAISALALSKTEIGRQIIKDTQVTFIPEDVPPPPPPPPPPQEPVKTEVPPQHRSSIDVVKPPFPVPTPDSNYELVKLPPVPPTPTPVGKVDEPLPLPPPPPPPPKKLEPARAKANLASYVSDADYPASAVRNEEQGTTRFRLSVGPDGRVKECTVTGSSGSSALDTTTCRIMKNRARFTAARDSEGNASTDTVNSAIRWVLPED